MWNFLFRFARALALISCSSHGIAAVNVGCGLHQFEELDDAKWKAMTNIPQNKYIRLCGWPDAVDQQCYYDNLLYAVSLRSHPSNAIILYYLYEAYIYYLYEVSLTWMNIIIIEKKSLTTAAQKTACFNFFYILLFSFSMMRFFFFKYLIVDLLVSGNTCISDSDFSIQNQCCMLCVMHDMTQSAGDQSILWHWPASQINFLMNE